MIKNTQWRYLRYYRTHSSLAECRWSVLLQNKYCAAAFWRQGLHHGLWLYLNRWSALLGF